MSKSTSADPTLVMVNGEFTDQISVSDRGFAFADGLFESMLFVAGTIPLLDKHIERLHAGCRSLQLVIQEHYLREQIALFLARAKSLPIVRGKLKLTVTRGHGGRGCYPLGEGMTNVNSSLILHLSSVSAQNPSSQSGSDLIDSDSVRLTCARQPLVYPQALVGIKHLSRLPYVIAALGEALHNGEELLFLDEKGRIVETMHHNVFFIDGKTLLTPCLNSAGVAGIARALITETLASNLGFTSVVRDIFLSDLGGFDGCFIANAVRGLSAVSAIDDIAFSIGDTYRQLDAAFVRVLDGAA